MFRWALIFFVVAVIAALFGFGGLAGTAAGIAEVIFWVGVVLFVATLIGGLLQGRGGSSRLP